MLKLDEALNALEPATNAKKSIPVFKICEFEHDEYGSSLLSVLPSDCLVIQLDCREDISQIPLPERDHVCKSRAERKEYLPEEAVRSWT